ncbi:MAG: leucyl aminopeptidase family protein, partial [Pseudomonadota bacterium]
DGYIHAFVIVTDETMQDHIATCMRKLPKQIYRPHLFIDSDPSSQPDKLSSVMFAWAMGYYRYYLGNRQADNAYAQLLCPQEMLVGDSIHEIKAHYVVRDLINMPANILTPEKFAIVADQLLDSTDIMRDTITGDDLLAQNFPMIHAVGRASANGPCLFRASFGQKGAPKIAIIGKGVCFDSGGINIKSASNMFLMKKDMGGAALALALAWLLYVQKAKLQVELFLPLVENAISANAFRPSDVLTARNGTTVEVGDTDAEGRLILADCLACAAQSEPCFMVDCATLTGAARVAMGTDIPAFFTNDHAIGRRLQDIGQNNGDPVWQLPLHQGYLKQMRSNIADISSTGSGGYGGAITAALFLQQFVDEIAWVHVDMMAWSLTERGMKTTGGAAQGLHSLNQLLLGMQVS